MTVRKSQLLLSLGLVHSAGKLLLARRNEPAIPALHGKLEVPGGKVEFGELPEATCVREVREETGYKIRVIEPCPFSMMTMFTLKGVKQQAILLCYAAELAAMEREAVVCGKVSEVKWFNPDDINHLEIMAGSREFVWWGARFFGLWNKLRTVAGFGFVELESTDLLQDRKRSYVVTYQTVTSAESPYVLVRKWGRMGGELKSTADQYRSYEEADYALLDCLRKRRRHGYRLVEVTEFFPRKDWVEGTFERSTEETQPTLFDL